MQTFTFAITVLLKALFFFQVGSTGDKPANQPCYYHGNQKGQSTTSILNLISFRGF